MIVRYLKKAVIEHRAVILSAMGWRWIGP